MMNVSHFFSFLRKIYDPEIKNQDRNILQKKSDSLSEIAFCKLYFYLVDY
jgi:hypothetical protein